MKDLAFIIAMIFLLASASLAQDPDFAITVGTVYADSSDTVVFVPVFFSASDSFCAINMPLSWSPLNNGIIPLGIRSEIIPPIFCLDFDDSVYLDDGYIDILGWDSFGDDGCDSMQSRQIFRLAFAIDPQAPPQIIAIDSAHSPRSGGPFVGLCDGFTALTPAFTPGHIYYGMPNSAEEISSPLPGEFTLMQNYPNPFSHKTQMEFSLKSTQTARIEIFNIEGRLLDAFAYQNLSAGDYKINWEPKSEIPSGIYFYRLTCGDHSQVKKFTLLR